MKSFFVFCIMLCAFFQVEAQRCKQINVFIEGIVAPGTVNLVGVFGEQNYRADTAVMKADGQIVFSRDTGYLEGFYYILLPDNKTSLQILLDKDPTLTLRTKMSGLVEHMQVEGSLDNQLLYNNLQYQMAGEPRAKSISERLKKELPNSPPYVAAQAEFDQMQVEKSAHLAQFKQKHPNAFFTKFKFAGQNPILTYPKKANGTIDTAAQIFAYRAAFWNDVDFSDVRLLRSPVYFNKLKRFIMELTPPNQDSLIPVCDYVVQRSLANPEIFKFTVNWIAMQYKAGKSTIMDGDAVYAFLIEKYWTPELAYWSDAKEIASLRQQAKQMKGSLLGLKGQDVRAKDFDGNYRSIYDATSKFVLVYIYNPNCEHCQEQTPVIWSLYQELHPSNLLDVYSIVTTTTREEWGAYRQKVGYTWPDVYDTDPYESKWPLKYHVDITPELYLMDPERKIIAKNINANQLREIIDRERKARGF